MAEFNTYPIFVADQVLTADHLNEVVSYLDEQDRLSRNKLIGIGIVCGLELKTSSEQIDISKGVGVTSEGFLITQDQASYINFRPYNLPEYFSSEYKSVYEDWQMWELLTAEKALEFDDTALIKDNVNFMKNKVVVLLLEMKEKPLKNCIDTDCDDKGDKVEFNVRPLLVDKNELDDFIKSKGERPAVNGTQPSVQGNVNHIQLKRFNVPVKELKNTNDVFNAFLQIVDEGTLKKLAEALNDCYIHYNPILGVDTNPFEDSFDLFKEKLEQIKNSNPFFIQYYYDWIDDIIKTYHEFNCKIVDVHAICCPDEDLFPLHLMLGEANKDTSIDRNSRYRNYFIYSPLFNEQKDRLAEVQMLFGKLKSLVDHFVIPNPNTFFNAPVKITPSNYYDKFLSDRSIPYYYNPLGLFQVWSWNKTRTGSAKTNLSYNAAQYNNADTIVYPLKYDIERFNFFRVEGHIGKSFNNALTSVINQRDQYNLAFDVVALSTATISSFFNPKDHECQFNDLKAIYEVLLAELQCRLGGFDCMAAKIKYTLAQTGINISTNLSTGVTINRGDVSGFDSGNTISARNVDLSENIKGISTNLLVNLGLLNLKLPNYQRGDFLKNHCTIEKGSVGEAYLNAIKNGVSFTRPAGFNKTLAFISINPMFLVYAYVFYFIDSVENLFAVSLNEELEDFDADVFSARYKSVMEIVDEIDDLGEELKKIDPTNEGTAEILKNLKSIGFYEFAINIHAIRHICLDEKFEALKKTFENRKKELQLLNNFMHYLKKHPGIEHKAGVPNGGTFVMVYHETPPRNLVADLTVTGNLIAKLPGSISTFKNYSKELANYRDLIKTSYVTDPGLLKNFESALGKYLNLCKDIDDNTKKEINDILVTIPKEPEPLRFQVPEQAVIADFYIPYICCSDCPPVSYVVPKTPEDVLSIQIKPTEFCNDDERVYPVRVSPQGGQLTVSNGGVTAGTFEFGPKGVKAGVNTLTYTLSDGRSTSIDVLISAAFNVSFKHTIGEDGVTVLFEPDSGAKDKEVLWDFGDGSTSDEHTPKHTYKFEGQTVTFNVVLTAADTPCVAVADQEITLTRPLEDAFDLVPNVFCIKDTKEYEFDINPFPATVEKITNNDKLIINLHAANGSLTFIPNKHKIKNTKDFHLEYLGIPLDVKVVVSDASFFMNIEQHENDFSLMLRAKKEDATDYLWTIQQGDLNYTFKVQKITLSLTELKIQPGQNILLNLMVNYQLPSGRCIDEKKYDLTEGIFFKHVDKGEFDNSTTA